ncbi:hypothetical protein [Algicella marina]|uniref:Cytochrome P460 domain-containing protein n=1 Tax=Algicella marina TaxID=2683284 RepID=A0A6P1T5U4_9RHOB|nr:hypothetical protein [Algicella marina]QHQ36659.1 hypothetical protein GO499_16495 [Algicella marina]
MADGLIAIPAAASVSGIATCRPARLGLVGMHIVTKVTSGHGDKWIWSTFEHRANAPEAANAREINSLYAKDLFPGGCQSPQNTAAALLHDPDCPDCIPNAPHIGPALWAGKPPFAVSADGRPLQPAQITRCWKIFGPTRSTNSIWQAMLGTSPLANYMLISSQWRGANPDPIFPDGELPRYLTNTTMESFLQTDTSGTCLGCHATARTPEGAPADFTFLFR